MKKFISLLLLFLLVAAPMMAADFDLEQGLNDFFNEMGFVTFFITEEGWKNAVMILIGCFLLYLAIKKEYEPLLLLPIAFGMLLTNLPVGYHREMQLLKDILFPTLELMHKCLYMADYMLQHIRINENILDAPIYDYLFTVEEVNRRTLEGMPFRDAYKSVGIEVNEGRFSYQGAPGKTNGQLTPDDLRHTSLGSLGNLCTEKIRSKMESAAQF